MTSTTAEILLPVQSLTLAWPGVPGGLLSGLTVAPRSLQCECGQPSLPEVTAS